MKTFDKGETHIRNWYSGREVTLNLLREKF